MAKHPTCHICLEPLKKKNSVLTADIYKGFLKGLLKDNGGDVEKLCISHQNNVVNGLTMQYFYQFDLFSGEQRDDTLQVSWLMNPPQRFGIVFPRIPEDRCLFMLAHEECLQKKEPIHSAPLADIVKVKNGVKLTLSIAREKWFNKRGWQHVCTELYGAKGAAEIEHRALLA
jgi:hypothetical protein